MSSIKTNKKDESSINDSNSKSFLKSNNQGELFPISLFQKQNNRRTKMGGDLTASYTAKFVTNKNSIKRNRTLTFNEDNEKKIYSSVSETELSLKNLEHKYSKRSKNYEESTKSKNTKKDDKIIVDNIEHIYSKIKEIPRKIKIQNYFIYSVALLIGILDWNFLFQLSENKLERNYCFTNLYQLDSCSIEQICKNYDSKLNYIIYDKNTEFHGKSENDNKFLEEKKYINYYYKQFFLKYSYILSSNRLLNTYQIFSSIKDKTNFVVILTKKGQWNIFLRYFFICQKKNFVLLILIMYCLGGFFGSLILGFQADIRGRKKIIHISLFIVLLALSIILIYFLGLDLYYLSLKKQFNKKYSYINKNNIEYNEILENIYSQEIISKIVNKTFIVYLIGVFLLNFGALPLIKTSLSLLIENATNEQYAIKYYRKYNLFIRGCSPFFTVFLIVSFNSLHISIFLLYIYALILFISSFFIVNESMRYLYEYCEWKQLSDFIMNNFILEEQKDIQFLNNKELKNFQREENKIISKEYEIRRLNLKAESENDDIFEKNNFYNYYKRKKSFTIRKIKIKADIINKYYEVSYNPFIIIISLKANRYYIKNKNLFLSILILLNILLIILQQEMIRKPFFREKDLYFSKGQNYIGNSNFLGDLIIIYFSNFLYYYLFKISCFKIVIIISSLMLSLLSFLYYIHSLDSKKKTPIYYNQYNFGMFDLYYRDYFKMNQLYLHAMYFAINGIFFYIHLLLIKMSKTFYRCSLFSLHSFILMISLIIAQIFNYEIKKPFILLGFINFICLILIFFLNEITDSDSQNLVNDLKRNIEKKVKHDKYQ